MTLEESSKQVEWDNEYKKHVPFRRDMGASESLVGDADWVEGRHDGIVVFGTADKSEVVVFLNFLLCLKTSVRIDT